MIKLRNGHLDVQELTLDAEELRSRLENEKTCELKHSTHGPERYVHSRYVATAKFTSAELALLDKVGFFNTDGLWREHPRGGHVLKYSYTKRHYVKYSGCKGEASKRAKEEKVFAEVQSGGRTGNALETYFDYFINFVKGFNEKHAEKYAKQFEDEGSWDWADWEPGELFCAEKQKRIDDLQIAKKDLQGKLKALHEEQSALIAERSLARQRGLAKEILEPFGTSGFVPEKVKKELVEKLQNGTAWKNKRQVRPGPAWAR